MTPKSNHRREAVALALARGLEIKAAAQECRVGERTVHTWLVKDPTFKKRVQELREQMYREAVTRLSALAGKAAATLDRLLDSSNEPVALGAAKAVLEHASTFWMGEKLEERLRALEEQA